MDDSNVVIQRSTILPQQYIMMFVSSTGYAIFVVIGILPECEADQVLSLVRAEPPPPRAGHSSSKHPPHPKQTSRETLDVNPGKGYCEDISRGVKSFFNPLHSPGKGNLRNRGKEEQDLQVAMAMSVSLQQSQEEFEIDQQLQLHYQQSAKEGDPAFCVSDEVGGSDYEEEEEEVALTAAIHASLGKPVDDIRHSVKGHHTISLNSLELLLWGRGEVGGEPMRL